MPHVTHGIAAALSSKKRRLRRRHRPAHVRRWSPLRRTLLIAATIVACVGAFSAFYNFRLTNKVDLRSLANSLVGKLPKPSLKNVLSEQIITSDSARSIRISNVQTLDYSLFLRVTTKGSPLEEVQSMLEQSCLVVTHTRDDGSKLELTWNGRYTPLAAQNDKTVSAMIFDNVLLIPGEIEYRLTGCHTGDTDISAVKIGTNSMSQFFGCIESLNSITPIVAVVKEDEQSLVIVPRVQQTWVYLNSQGEYMSESDRIIVRYGAAAQFEVLLFDKNNGEICTFVGILPEQPTCNSQTSLQI